MGAPRKGRGAGLNPAGRFEASQYETDPDVEPDLDPEAGEPPPPTELRPDHARTIITYNDSPDLNFAASLNPYRGCEHGCVYCYARPTHEYVGLSAGLDFERIIFAKHAAPELLRAELAATNWKPQPVAISGVTDAYQPTERTLEITRRCLQVFHDFRNPVGIVTKNALVTRDADILGEMAAIDTAAVMISVTTLDAELARKLEPRASAPHARLRTIADLRAAGIPVGVLVAPVIPGLNDHEIPAILSASAEAGAQFASYVMLRLPLGVADLFEDWLRRHYPDRHARVMDRVRDMRGGQRNSAEFGERFRGSGPFAALVQRLFRQARERAGIPGRGPQLATHHFRRHDPRQPDLFG